MNDTFERNIEAAKQILTPEYIEMIKAAEQVGWVEQIHSEDGTPNLLVQKGNKTHSIYNLKGWAEDIAARIKDAVYDASQATLCIGIGLGYFLSEAIKIADDKHHFIVIEPEPYMIKLAFECCDLSEAITNRQVMITPTTDDVSIALSVINETNTIDSWSVVVEAYTLNHLSYEQISVNAMGILNQIRCNIGTVTGAGHLIADNDIANLPYVIHRRGVNELRGLYKDMPAVLISTGPSLGKNLWRLIDAQERVIIIAVGQALRPLLSYGIRPDFICSVDFGEVNMTHYDGLMDSDIPLVALNRSFSPLLKQWSGPMFVSASSILEVQPDREKRVHQLLTDKGETLQGGSVAHMCLGLGLLLECNPLIMIGQDLAYDGEQSHFQQADSTGTLSAGSTGDLQWKVQDPRCHLYGDSYTMGPPITVPGYFLRNVITNSGLASFITSFEQFIKLFPATKVINATEGGAHISGAVKMSLSKAIEKYCPEEQTKSREVLKPLLSNVDNAMELVNRAIPLLKNEIDILKQIVQHARLGIEANLKVSKIRNRNWKNRDAKKVAKFDKVIKQNTKHSNAAHELSMKLPLIKLAIYNANRRIQHSDMITLATKESVENNIESARIRVKRNRIILQAAKNAATSLKKSYDTALKILQRCAEHNDLNLLTSRGSKYIPDISDAENYFMAGNFARPMLDARRILKDSPDDERAKDILDKAGMMLAQEIDKAANLPDRTNEIDYIELITQAQEIGRDKKDFLRTITLFKRALEIYPEGDIGRWGLATAYMHVEEYDKSIAEYRTIIKNRPEIYQYQFELGQVLIAKGNAVKGLKQIHRVMEKTEQFDSFLYVVGDLFASKNKLHEAIQTYKLYLDKFPVNYAVWKKLETVAGKAGETEIEAMAAKRYNSLRPEEDKAE
jgi:predicted negative regulator of RcsB-dependent stress response